MLTSVVLELESVTGPAADVPGFVVHGWFLRQLVEPRDRRLSRALHANVRHKPFTVSPLLVAAGSESRESRNGKPCGSIRLTGLSEQVSSLLLSLTPESVGELRFGACAFACRGARTAPGEHPLVWRADFDAVMAATARTDARSAIRLTFASPTAFAGPIRNTVALFPEPDRVFTRLAEIWNAHAPVPLAVPPSHVAGLVRNLYVDRYDLQTVGVPMKHQVSRGFTGSVEYRSEASTPEDVCRLAHQLAAFAAFSGVGMRTTQGMGQTFGEPVARADDRRPRESPEDVVAAG